ncbi:MAG: TonB-dependent receptor plug domain-containing protein, partial [Gemmatimonas sp.]
MPRYVPRYLGRLVAGIFAFGSPFVSSAQATAGARTARTGTDTTATDSLHGRNPISGASLAPMSARTNPFTVGQLSAENMPVPGLTSPLQSLDGKIAGVTVSQLTGAPGADVSLVLRTAFGPFNSAAPQIVVDGVWLNAAHPMTAQDIESLGVTNIEVLKGPVAAALYGYRGISGVVVVTTNRGRTLPLGETRLTVRSEVGPGLAGEFLQPLEAHPYRVNLAG